MVSKAGSLATHEAGLRAQLADAIEHRGLHQVAREFYEQEENERVGKARLAILRLLAQLGLPEDVPFVAEEYAAYHPPHARVCVDLDGFLLNYRKATAEHPEELVLILGHCSKCDNQPFMIPVRSIADLAAPGLPHLQRAVAEFVCGHCSRRS